jgi:hypothetical protein
MRRLLPTTLKFDRAFIHVEFYIARPTDRRARVSGRAHRNADERWFRYEAVGKED